MRNKKRKIKIRNYVNCIKYFFALRNYLVVGVFGMLLQNKSFFKNRISDFLVFKDITDNKTVSDKTTTFFIFLKKQRKKKNIFLLEIPIIIIILL